MKKVILVCLLFSFCVVLNAQVYPNGVKLAVSRTESKLVDLNNKALTSEQIDYLAENGFDTDSYYSLSKRLKSAERICLTGAGISVVTGTALFIKSINSRQDWEIISSIGLGGLALLFMLGDFVYTFVSVSNVANSAQQAYLRIGATDSGIGMALRF